MHFKHLHILFILFLSVAKLNGAGNVRTTFKNKKIELEFGIENARKTNKSSVDLYCKECDVEFLKIEYKSGPTSIDIKKIKEQFIQRDLYNADNLNEIQWRMEGTELTPEKLKAWMRANKTTLNSVKNRTDEFREKFADWFGLDDPFDVIEDVDIDGFVNDNFSMIFRLRNV